jgi:oligopeptide/dipeptide ABC transporter ATP-binding protein
MYAGKVVESGPVRRIFKAPRHPYTDGLIRSVPSVGRSGEELFQIEGQPPNPAALPPGCPFAPRCTYARDRCRESIPPETAVVEGGVVSCWYPLDGQAARTPAAMVEVER